MEDQERIELYVSVMLSGDADRDPADDLNTISEYFACLGRNIDYEELGFSLSDKLLASFEPACLLLRQHLGLCPDSVRDEVNKILERQNLAELFATVANLSARDLRALRVANLRQHYPPIFRSVFSLAYVLAGTRARAASDYGITPERLFQARIALNRISQILRYVRVVAPDFAERAFDDSREYYDPNLVNRNKILALVSLLRVETERIPDEAARAQIDARLAEVEEEIRKPKPRWGKAILTCFILLGVVADLKTLRPEIYERPYKVVQQMLAVIHEEGIVQTSEGVPLLESGGEEGSPSPAEEQPRGKPAVIPSVEPTIRRDDDSEPAAE